MSMAEAKKFEYIIEFEPYYLKNDNNELCFKSKTVKEMVRCRDCRHNYNGLVEPRCDFTDYKLTPNDYCSRAIK